MEKVNVFVGRRHKVIRTSDKSALALLNTTKNGMFYISGKFKIKEILATHYGKFPPFNCIYVVRTPDKIPLYVGSTRYGLRRMHDHKKVHSPLSQYIEENGADGLTITVFKIDIEGFLFQEEHLLARLIRPSIYGRKGAGISINCDGAYVRYFDETAAGQSKVSRSVYGEE